MDNCSGSETEEVRGVDASLLTLRVAKVYPIEWHEAYDIAKREILR